MKNLLGQGRDFLVSLKLTVVLLLFSLVLVFAATLDQVNLGVWAVQEKYFQSFIITTRAGNFAVPIFPGGYLIGGLLLANLIAAHVYRFALSWQKAGILLAHSGLILLLLGELLSGLWQEDFSLRLTAGETRNYVESFRRNELVFTDTTDAAFDDVVSIPEPLLARQRPLQHPRLPFQVVPKSYYPNSLLQIRPPNAAPSAATAGFGADIVATPQPVTSRQDERNFPSVFVELRSAEGSLGTYLVSTQIVVPQEFTYAGHTWKMALRVQRAYQPFSLTLVKFSHDRYPGTDIPKNFSSRLRLNTPDGREDREVLIYMNNPLRYAGLTFYQAGFENDDRTTVLQVVRNPSWLLPYLSCGLIALGLLVQFGRHLVKFVHRRAVRPPATAPAGAALRPISARAAKPSGQIPVPS